MKCSFSLCISLLLVAFLAHSIWNLIAIFRIPSCDSSYGICYKYYLNRNPKLDLLVYVGDNARKQYEQILSVDNFDYSKPFETELSLELSINTRRNGSLSILTIVVPSTTRKKHLSVQEIINLPDSSHLRHSLTKYAIPSHAAFNLLKDKSKPKPQPHSTNVKPVTHLKKKFALMMITEHFELTNSKIPMEIYDLIRVNNERQILPIVTKDFMQMRTKDLQEIQPDMHNVTFTFLFTPVSVGKVRFVKQIGASMKEFLALGFTEKEFDELKGVFADTNLYLLCATIIIGSVHLLLDFLTFKNDVKFWKNQTSMAGLSTTSVFWRAFSQTIIFFYLLDEGTSLLVLIPAGIATLIEFWKVSKIFKRKIKRTNGFNFIWLNEHTQSAEELQTKKYDEECMKYLSYVLYPLCFGAAIYSLLYQPHKSWYSWTITSLVNGVYAFGFLFMLPQLFINYRLKSVAALPWRAFTYRAFNTFIDDVFAFIITMPTAHRVACFRDDVVFIIYLYQRWLYPVDKTRREVPGDNEFEENDNKSNAAEEKKTK